MGGVVRAGFVLAGGRSSRMGRDKATLPLDGLTLVERIALRVRSAAGNVTIVGSPERYGGFGYPVVPDAVDGCGPLGGLRTALGVTQADWNLVTACDMPGLTADFLRDLLDAAENAGLDCLAALSHAGMEPLCAVYHRRCLGAAEQAIRHKMFKMQDFVSNLHSGTFPVQDASLLRNVNTPEEWSAR